MNIKKKKPTVAETKNKTLRGLVMHSPASGAVYYWKRGSNKAEVIAVIPPPPRIMQRELDSVILPPHERPIGMLANFDHKSVSIDAKNDVIANNGLGWVVLKEIHK